MTPQSGNEISNSISSLVESRSNGEREILNEESFQRMLAIERKRTERSRCPFLLMLLETDKQEGRACLSEIAITLLPSSRDTDVIGWYRNGTVFGVIFTGLAIADKESILAVIRNRVNASLQGKILLHDFSCPTISYHFYPDDWEGANSDLPLNPVLYQEVLTPNKNRQSRLTVKRAIDLVGSALALLLCLPLLWIIGLAIKLTSGGPVLFKQKRIGQYGKRFVMLKFRSMHIGNDHNVHRKFVTRMIASEEEPEDLNAGTQAVYKITNDKRVTLIGKFLRRTSLDEIPQFFNVLKGEMSLVGPRPSVPYELAAYQTWHRRRVLDFKPGITGLWQVNGRSRVRFDEMVRLDLQYASTWSLWLDLKILLRTPLAVIAGTGAH